ncbi:tubulin-specific chaperone A-like protein [Dinothrombium tinctorium]|uniref:Tubulin-specific chaperone A n=1 Tax=Dinothrombium tinctorium TaxID=1965070 RepID=A0A3S3P1V6_9ACAR|nr:tubulin-specific chaperone A-like protein [Dinothrombium tinctorium]RWS06707.1 tubulin-specific chaperone A-like protein [Dinothrombium tinctorium]RWS06728.1 tubulin-specific chaperone A-like protein [Dinothrombium tinctorium]
MADSRVKQLRIKTGVLKRVLKEKEVYEKEVENEKQRLNKMINEAKDEYDIRKQEEVINETLMMLPDCQKRIYNAYNDLKSLLQESEEDLQGTEDFETAKQVLSQVAV